MNRVDMTCEIELHECQRWDARRCHHRFDLGSVGFLVVVPVQRVGEVRYVSGVTCTDDEMHVSASQLASSPAR